MDDELLKWADGLQTAKPTGDKRADALRRAASTLGVDAADLGAIISFETAGSFNPHKVGGKGGKYKGLIQFGIPEQRRYYKPTDTFETQVEDGVVRYFQDRFKKVGRDTRGATLEDLYTTVIAGSPTANRNRKDAFGTSAKSGTRKILKEHRPKVIKQFFGGQDTRMPSVDVDGIWADINPLLDESVGSQSPDDIWAGIEKGLTPQNNVVPESLETIQEQAKAAMNLADKNRVGVLTTSPEQNAVFGNLSGFQMVDVGNGKNLWVNTAKARKQLRLRKPEDIDTFFRRNPDAVQKYTGTAVNVGDNTTNGAAVLTTAPDGTELSAKIVNTPETAIQQAELDKQSFPNSRSEIVDAQDVVVRRSDSMPVEGAAEEVIAQDAMPYDIPIRSNAEIFSTLPDDIHRQLGIQPTAADVQANINAEYQAWAKTNGLDPNDQNNIDSFKIEQQAIADQKNFEAQQKFDEADYQRQIAAYNASRQPSARSASPQSNRQGKLGGSPQIAQIDDVPVSASWTYQLGKVGSYADQDLNETARQIGGQLNIDPFIVRSFIQQKGYSNQNESESQRDSQAQAGIPQKRILDAKAVSQLKDYAKYVDDKTAEQKAILQTYLDSGYDDVMSDIATRRDIGILSPAEADAEVAEYKKLIERNGGVYTDKGVTGKDAPEGNWYDFDPIKGFLGAGVGGFRGIRDFLFGDGSVDVENIRKGIARDIKQYGSVAEALKVYQKRDAEVAFSQQAGVGGQASETLKTVGRYIAELPALAGDAGAMTVDFDPLLNQIMDTENTRKSLLSATKTYRDAVQNDLVLAQNPAYRDDFIVNQVAQTFAQLGTQMLLAPLTGGASVALPALEAASSQYRHADEKGASKLARFGATGIGAILALPEVLLHAKYLKGMSSPKIQAFLDNIRNGMIARLGGTIAAKEAETLALNTVRGYAMQLAKKGVTNIPAEYLQERIEDFGNETYEKLTYNPNIKWKDIIVPSSEKVKGYMAAGLGGGFGSVVEVATKRLANQELQQLAVDLPSLLEQNRVSTEKAEEIRQAVTKTARKRGIEIPPIVLQPIADGTEQTIDTKAERVDSVDIPTTEQASAVPKKVLSKIEPRGEQERGLEFDGESQPTDINKFDQPILVREVVDKGVDKQAAITDFNKVSARASSASESAVASGKNLKPETVKAVVDTVTASGTSLSRSLDDVGVDVVNRLIADGVFTENERNQLVDVENNGLTAYAKERVKSLLTAHLFADLEQFKDASKSLQRTIADVTVPLLDTSTDKDWDIVPQVRDAIDLINRRDATSKGQDIVEFSNQIAIDREDATPQVVAIANALDSHNAKVFQVYAGEFRNNETGAMFGSLSPEQAFDVAFMPSSKVALRRPDEIAAASDDLKAARTIPMRDLVAEIEIENEYSVDNGILEALDVRGFEMLRRLIGEDAAFDGSYLDSRQVTELVSKLDEVIQNAENAKVDAAPLNGLKSLIEDAVDDRGLIILWNDKALPEEKAHRVIAEVRAESRAKQIDQSVFDGIVASSAFKRAMAGRFGQDYGSSTQAMQVEEFSVKALLGQYDEIDASTEEQQKESVIEAVNFFESLVANSKMENAVERLAAEIAYDTQALKEIRGRRESQGDVQTAERGREQGSDERTESRSNLSDEQEDRYDGVTGELFDKFQPKGPEKMSQTSVSLNRKADVPIDLVTFTSTTNSERLDFAQQQLDKGLDNAIKWTEAQIADGDHNSGATGVVGVQILSELGKQGEIGRLNDFAKKLLPAITDAAQMVQAMSILNIYSPETAAANAALAAKRAGKDLTDRQAEKATQIAQRMRDSVNAGAIIDNAYEVAQEELRELELENAELSDALDLVNNDRQLLAKKVTNLQSQLRQIREEREARTRATKVVKEKVADLTSKADSINQDFTAIFGTNDIAFSRPAELSDKQRTAAVEKSKLFLANNLAKITPKEFQNRLVLASNGLIDLETAKDIHAEAIAFLRPEKTPQAVDAVAANRLRQSHYREARKREAEKHPAKVFGYDGKYKKFITAVIDEGMWGQEPYSDEAIAFAILRKMYPDVNEALAQLKDQFPDISKPKQRQIVRESSRLLMRVKANIINARARSRDGAKLTQKDIELIEADRKLESRERQNIAREAANFYDALSKTQVEQNLESAVSFRKANLLTAIKTHMVNLFGNGFNVTGQEISQAPASFVDMAASLVTGQRTVTGISPSGIWNGLYNLFSQDETLKNANFDSPEGKQAGVTAAYHIWRYGGTLEDMERLQHTESNLSEAYSGRVPKWFDGYVNQVFRTLGAEDAIFKVYAFRRSLEQQAKAIALTEKKEGSLQGSVDDRRKELLRHPTPFMQEKADDFAHYITFQNNNGLSSWISGIKSGKPVVRAAIETLVPYDRTPTNIILSSLAYSPTAVIPAARAIVRGRQVAKGKDTKPYREFVRQYRGAVKASIDDFQELSRADQARVLDETLRKAFSRQQQEVFASRMGTGIVGTGVFSLGYVLAAAGIMAGAMSYDDEDRKEAIKRKESGIENGSIQTPYGRFVLPKSPITMALVAGATMYEQMRTSNKQGVMAALDAGTEAFGDMISEYPYINSAYRTYKDVSRGSVGQFVGNLASGYIPASAMVRSISDVGDSQERAMSGYKKNLPSTDVFSWLNEQGRGFRNSFLRGVPVARNYLVDASKTQSPDRGGAARRFFRQLDPFNLHILKADSTVKAKESPNADFLKTPQARKATTDDFVMFLMEEMPVDERKAYVDALRKKADNAAKRNTLTDRELEYIRKHVPELKDYRRSPHTGPLDRR